MEREFLSNSFLAPSFYFHQPSMLMSVYFFPSIINYCRALALHNRKQSISHTQSMKKQKMEKDYTQIDNELGAVYVCQCNWSIHLSCWLHKGYCVQPVPLRDSESAKTNRERQPIKTKHDSCYRIVYFTVRLAWTTFNPRLHKTCCVF